MVIRVWRHPRPQQVAGRCVGQWDAPVDARSTARRALADLRAALARWLSSNGVVAEYEIAGRRMRFASAEDIRKRISLAENEVAREDAEQRLAAGLGGRRRVMVRF